MLGLVLKKRIITASILMPIAAIIILQCSTNCVALAAAVVFALGAWEWTKLIGIDEQLLRLAAVVFIVGIGWGCKYFSFPVDWIFSLAMVWWFVGLIILTYYPTGKKILSNKVFGVLVGCLLLVPSWIALTWLHGSFNGYGPMLLLSVCALVWAADIGAYLVGKTWGKKKLLPKVSPKKTWLGVAGALVAGTVVINIALYFLFSSEKFIWFVTLGLVTVIFAIVGDLVESLFKRMQGLKDSGNLLPGHGGILDRIDSLLAALPTFALGLQFLQWN